MCDIHNQAAMCVMAKSGISESILYAQVCVNLKPVHFMKSNLDIMFISNALV
jgi:hypothetical protein